MNIIKFKDQVHPSDDLFNTYLKGKYAYWIQMRYVVPFELIDQSRYIELEQCSCKIKDITEVCWDLFNGDLELYVDSEGTDSANNIMPFERANAFTSSPGLTVDQIKRFRSWLAKSLLEFDCNFDGEQKHQLFTESFTMILRYYANGMYNEVVRALLEINPEYSLTNPQMSSCGCSQNLNIYNLNLNSMCDPLSMYREHVYKEMVNMFGNAYFWADFSDTFLRLFKIYIDNIIQMNLPLTTTTYSSNFVDCPCTGQNEQQDTLMDILKRLSQSLEYMYTGETKGHINYISKSFHDWASMLYEIMEWV